MFSLPDVRARTECLDVLENNLVLEVGSIGEDSNVIDLSEFDNKFLC